MGRHSSTTARGNRSPVVLLSVLLVVVLVAWFTVDLIRDKLSANGCDDRVTLTVTAAPDIAPVIMQAGARASEEDKEGCYEVSVASRDSASTAESLAVSDGSERPDAWIPESTMWLQRAQGKGAWNVPITGTSVASSPVVLAVAETTASEAGWPSTPITWDKVVGPSAGLRVGFPDPARDPAGLSTLLASRELAKNSANPPATNAAIMRRLSATAVTDASELVNQLPGTSTAEPISAFPTSEVAVLRHNVKDGTKLVAAYADPPVPALDYPYVVLPDVPEGKRTVAERFLDRLISQQTADALADAGFRTPDGKVLRDRSPDKRTSAVAMTPVAMPDAAAVDEILNLWAAVNLSGRILVLIDVSGSMNQQVPGTDLTRMTVTAEAAAQGITLFKPTTKLGWWLFSTKLDGPRDYIEWLPMRPVSTHLADGAVDKIRSIKAVPNGATGLFDSAVAAYQAARQNWEPGRINAVIIMTDGKNEDPGGIHLDQALNELAKLRDPRRPLPIIGIGIGPDVDPAELTALAEATGGKSFTTEDPAKIKDVFHEALSTMLCQPPACRPGAGGS